MRSPERLRFTPPPSVLLPCMVRRFRAAKAGAVVLLYVVDTWQEARAERWALGGAQKYWVAQSIRCLQRRLKERYPRGGVRLVLRRGDALQVLTQLVDAVKATSARGWAAPRRARGSAPPQPRDPYALAGVREACGHVAPSESVRIAADRFQIPVIGFHSAHRVVKLSCTIHGSRKPRRCSSA